MKKKPLESQWHKRKAGGRQTEETTGQKSLEVGEKVLPLLPSFHPKVSMCNLTCSAVWLPAVAGSPEALVLALQLVPCWAVTSP